MKQRIWELDALRGLCILAMVVVHLVYDLIDLFYLVSWDYPGIISLALDWGGILFLLLSGLCATLGHDPIRRGLHLLCTSLLITAATYLLYRIGFCGKDMLIYFGILHCLGSAMLLWPLFRRCSLPVLLFCGIGCILLGGFLENLPPVAFPWLMPFGLPWAGFASGDYFPLFPNFGWFLLGAVIGRSLYAAKTTRFPSLDPQNPLFSFLQFCGRKSLWIYLLHQPILSALLLLAGMASNP